MNLPLKTTNYFGKSMVVYDPQHRYHHIGEAIINGHVWDGEVIDYIIKNIADKDGIMFDIGVDIGSYTVALCDQFKEVIGLEPNFERYSIVHETVKLSNIPNVTLHNVACGSSMSKCNMTTQWLDRVQVGDGSIPVIPLDSFYPLANVKFLKIDVEGHEFEVLKGAEKIISSCKPDIYLETHPSINPGVKEKCEKWLTVMGYKVAHTVTDIDKFWKYFV